MGKAELEQRLRDKRARASVAGAFGAVFVLVGGAAFGGVLPAQWRVGASGLALAGLLAAFLFYAEARGVEAELAELEVERERAEFGDLLLARVGPVAQVDPTNIGVDAAAGQQLVPGGEIPRYVTRDVDDELHRAFERAFDGSGPWIVVAVGTSKVGKSRSVFEALKRSARDRAVDLIAPRDGNALRALLVPGQAPAARTCVLWLDDLEPFLNDDVTVHTLLTWRERFPGSVVAATLGGKGGQRVPASSRPAMSVLADGVLAKAHTIEVSRSTARETVSLLRKASRADAEGLERHGLAAFLVAAPKLELKLSTRQHERGDPPCAEGRALIDAAVDWARCGRTDAITEPTLRELWADYLGPSVKADDHLFATALDWALRPVAGTIALLQPAPDGYEPFDFVVGFLRDGAARSSPHDAAWKAAIDSATDAQAFAVSGAAFVEERLDQAVEALTIASTSSTNEVAAHASYNLCVALGELGRSEDAIAVCDDVIERFGDAPELASRESVARALVNKGFVLAALGRSEAAFAVYDEVLERFGDAPELDLRESVAGALIHKGVSLGPSEDAVAVLDEVLERFGDAPELGLRERVASALVNQGTALAVLGRSGAAVAVFDKVLERFGDAPELGIREQVATALVKKGSALAALGRPADELAVYSETFERFGDAPDLGLREQVASALANKGATLLALGRCEDALAVCEEVLERVGDAPDSDLRKSLASALVNKGSAVAALGRSEDAVAAFDEVLARFGESPEPELRELVAKTLFNKGFVLGGLGRIEDALAVFDEVLARFGDAPQLEVRVLIANALVNKAVALGKLGRSEDAVAAFEEVLARFGESPEPELRELVARTLYSKGLVLARWGAFEDAVAVFDEMLERFGDAPQFDLREPIANTLVYKGVALAKLGRSEDAVAVFDEVLERFSDARDPPLRQAVNRARMARTRCQHENR